MNSNMNKNNNLDKYVDELYSLIQINFQSTLNKIYSEELNKYSELLNLFQNFHSYKQSLKKIIN